MLGITLRDGLRPATVMAALASAGCHVALRGSALRIAPHLHVTAENVDTLLHVRSTTA